jgi:hypothetical protein
VLFTSQLCANCQCTQEEHLDAVNRIINSSSVLEDPEEIKKAHLLEEEIRMQTLEQTFVNAKY